MAVKDNVKLAIWHSQIEGDELHWQDHVNPAISLPIAWTKNNRDSPSVEAAKDYSWSL